jgi:hypothetical protein
MSPAGCWHWRVGAYEVIRVNTDIVVVVNLGFEIFKLPVGEFWSEAKAALLTAKVVDWNTGNCTDFAVTIVTCFVEVNGIQRRARPLADRTRPGGQHEFERQCASKPPHPPWQSLTSPGGRSGSRHAINGQRYRRDATPSQAPGGKSDLAAMSLIGLIVCCLRSLHNDTRPSRRLQTPNPA